MEKKIMEELARFGQSVWLDNLSRPLIESGKLRDLVGIGLRGVTSNPAIFDKAISQSLDYDFKVAKMAGENRSAFEIYDELTVRDVQDAADILKPVYDKSSRLDGYVSLEVNPKLAHMGRETIQEAGRLRNKVNRPNLMLKIPATEEGFSAIEELTAEGININVTLIFSREQYEKSALAYIRGVRRFIEKGAAAGSLHSVASVFVSRIDTAVDQILDKLIAREKDCCKKDAILALKGQAGVANTHLIFKKSLEIFSSRDFLALKAKGANAQRPLWGSTAAKNPAYSDNKYVRELIAKGTVNTMPEKTLEAFLKNQEIKEALTPDCARSVWVIKRLESLGIDIDDICGRLLREGIKLFESSFDSLLKSLESKIRNA